MTQSMTLEQQASPRPAEQMISVIMANLNGATYIRQAIRSVLTQTHDRLELVIADDGSTDDSCRIIREEMQSDPRIILLEGGRPHGPAGARNRALAAAKGDWIAIVDSDDIIHPERFARLLRTALTLTSDIVADDIIFFGDDPLERNKTLLQDAKLTQPHPIDAVTLVTGSLHGSKPLSLGYLKPMIRRAALADLRFDESLLIDEDHDLYLRLLLSGATFTLLPDGMYLYRRHSASASYRLSPAKLRLMIAAQERLLQQVSPERAELARAVAQRLRQTQDQLVYGEIIEAIKAGQGLRAMGLLTRHPKCAGFLFRSLSERANRRFRRPHPHKRPLKIVLATQEQAQPAAFPDARIVHVPAVSDSGWMPSAAATWAYLADLSCAHDLDIVALDRPGRYALGLVPKWRSARIISASASTAPDYAHPVPHAEGI